MKKKRKDKKNDNWFYRCNFESILNLQLKERPKQDIVSFITVLSSNNNYLFDYFIFISEKC